MKIYWSPETEQSVLERLEVKNSAKDAHLLSRLSLLTMTIKKEQRIKRLYPKMNKGGCKKFCVYRILRFLDKNSICKISLSIF